MSKCARANYKLQAQQVNNFGRILGFHLNFSLKLSLFVRFLRGAPFLSP